MKNRLLNKLIIFTLIASMGLGSFPASVDAWQLSCKFDALRQLSVASAIAGDHVYQREISANGAVAVDDPMGDSAANDQTNGGTAALDASERAQMEARPARAVTTLGESRSVQSVHETHSDTADIVPAGTDDAEGAGNIPGAAVIQEADGAHGEIVVADRAVVDALGGRDFAGQVVKEIGGRKYILIGNEQQLRAIGSNEKVHTAVYQAVLRGVHWEVDKDENGDPIMLYGGDADLLASQNGTKDYALGKIDKDQGTLRGRCGVNQATGEIDPNMDIEDSGVSYAVDANYIIFRDIDLAGVAWEPLMFSGTMLGATAREPQIAKSLWAGFDMSGEGVPVVSAAPRPVISNVEVVQTGELSIAKQSGVGFFGTISSNHHDDDIFGVYPDRATVRNIILNGVTVNNGFTGVHVDESLVSALVGLLGNLIGGLLDLLLGPILALLGVPNVGKLVSNLLDIRKAAPDSLATGSFAGRAVGDVEIADCEVRSASVTSINNYTGGFIGYVQGETIYGAISGLVNGLVKLL